MIISKLSHPKIHNALWLLEADNGASLPEKVAVPDRYDFKAIEEELSQLNEEETDLFVSGEQSEREELMKSKNFSLSDQFLNDFFEGFN